MTGVGGERPGAGAEVARVRRRRVAPAAPRPRAARRVACARVVAELPRSRAYVQTGEGSSSDS